jgi:5-methylcytosine-specific restriction endonuclease McrA
MQRVFVFDHQQPPLMPCYPARARELLKAGKAAVYRRFPFTIILREREGGHVQNVTLKIDPGSQTTGLALVADFQRGRVVVWGANLQHKSGQIKQALESRRASRRSRRQRHTRYRPARFANRRRTDGWLPPSLMSRIQNVITWVKRLSGYVHICGLSYELVKFDTQIMQNPEMEGVQYQQGELYGYEVREFLLEKFGHQCAYCGAKATPLEVEHIVPRARGGSNRVSNLAMACNKCNVKKGIQTAAEFGHSEVQDRAKAPLKDAAAVNASRWALYGRLQEGGLPIETGTGDARK